MDTNGWDLYYKTDEVTGELTTTQMCYEPLINKDKSIFCMNFCYPCEYQLRQPRISYTKEFVDFVFKREIEFYKIFKDKPWAPEVIEITDNKIFFKWYNKGCNDIIYKDKKIEMYPNWLDQIENIILDQVSNGVYKATVYPHSHFFDNMGIMKVFDFYASAYINDSLIPYDKLKCLISNKQRFDEATEGDFINVATMFRSGLRDWSRWPGGLKKLYERIFL